MSITRTRLFAREHIAGAFVFLAAAAAGASGQSPTLVSVPPPGFEPGERTGDATPPAFSGAVLADCLFDNLFPLEDFGHPASQKSFSGGGFPGPFYAEAADDFMLIGDGPNPCILEEIAFAVDLQGAGTPEDCWSGVIVTIYEDVGAGPALPGAPSGCVVGKGPAGVPLNPPADPDHEPCIDGGIKCRIEVPMSNVGSSSLGFTCATGTTFEVTLFGLADIALCALEKNRKYWIAIAPVTDFDPCNQTYLLYSQYDYDHPAQQIFEALGAPAWIVVPGNSGVCPSTPPAGTNRDLAIRIVASKDLSAIPTVTEWGLIVMGLLLLTAGTIVIRRMRNPVPA